MPNRNQNNMPDGFEPPVPAWSSDWKGEANSLTTAIFAVQGDVTESFMDWVNSALKGNNVGPEMLDNARFTDKNSVVNTVYIGYWRDDGYAQWWSDDTVSAWWKDDERLREESGYWRECYSMPIERLETLHSTPNAHGVANLATELEGPIQEHAYAGAARDRIEVSGREDLTSPESIDSTKLHSESSAQGRRTTVVPPANMCVIRSGQDWGHCGDEEREFYLGRVHPTLIEGMDYLSNNPIESRCMSMRLMRGIDAENDLDQTFGLGYALDIHAFEEWAKSHPTHLKIFDTFMGHAGAFGENMQLRLWHEVSVLPDKAGQFEYINCHSHTGLLPYC